MKYIITIIPFFLLGHISIGQSDSVYYAISEKIIPEIQVIAIQGENGIRENYTYFKTRYWLGKTDTVSLTQLQGTKPPTSKKQQVTYHKYAACDSLINEIRNSSAYWELINTVEKKAHIEIGPKNIEFQQFTYSKNAPIKKFSVKCRDGYNRDLAELEKQLIHEIQRIKLEKVKRYQRIKSNTDIRSATVIDTFLTTFDFCDTDIQSLELIILQFPTDFVTAIDKLSESDFFLFTLKLNGFREEARVALMKKTLKSIDKRSSRKKKVIRKIKTRKAKKGSLLS